MRSDPQSERHRRLPKPSSRGDHVNITSLEKYLNNETPLSVLLDARALRLTQEGTENRSPDMQNGEFPSQAALPASRLRPFNLAVHAHGAIALAEGEQSGQVVVCESARQWHYEGGRLRVAHPLSATNLYDERIERAVGAKELKL